MKYLLLSILIFVSTLTSAETITSEFPCGETKKITEILKERYNEIPIVLGKADDIAKSLMSLWVNKTSGTWTLISTVDDFTCVIGTGNSLTIVQPKGKTI